MDKNETNPHVEKILYKKEQTKKTGICGMCGFNRGENKTHYKHGKTKPKYKNHRRKK